MDAKGSTSLTAIDVAAYILRRLGQMTTMKLQKLVYYCQAWHLVWSEMPLFPDKIEAWANGPVVPTLYERHRGMFLIDRLPLEARKSLAIEPSGKDIFTIDTVLDFYGNKDSDYLVKLTHLEEPWKQARKNANASPGENCKEEITHVMMAEYYGSLN